MLGSVLNTHQQWLCRRLSDLGYEVQRQVAIPDSEKAIREIVCEALTRADLILTTGGLGPTSDDKTRDVIAELLGRSLLFDPAILEQRVQSEGRAELAKLTSIKVLREMLARLDFNSTPDPYSVLHIDNTNLPPSEPAAKIVAHYGLKKA